MKKAIPLIFLALIVVLITLGHDRGPYSRHAVAADVCSMPPSADDKLEVWLKADCYKRDALHFAHDKEEKRKTGPALDTAPHGRVTVYYSPQIVAWLKQNRRGPVPDGAVVVKEMFGWDSGEFSGRAAMVKQKSGSYAGWYFYPGGYLAAGCIGCHASALSELTFSDLGHIEGTAGTPRGGGKPQALALASHPADPHPQPGRPPLLTPEAEALSVPPPSAMGLNLRENPDFERSFPWPVPGGMLKQTVQPFPSWYRARAFVVPPGTPPHFVPATNCYGCHDAQVADKTANMVLPAERSKQFLNISPYAEWSASLMGLSGRDPVFHAQLESEKALHPEKSSDIDDTCYRCHGAAGQRQLHQDLKRPFPHEAIYAEGDHALARYGALAREGVTCTVCHHISPDGLGQERTFTGQFSVGKPEEIYGPYSDSVKAQPMKQALGMTPQGSTHMSSSALCGSCHVVILPQVPSSSASSSIMNPSFGRFHEQTTYLEWKNSAYEHGSDAKTCQGCHMPAEITLPSQSSPVLLGGKIANIEEFLPGVPSSLPAQDINLLARQPYSRHTLVGINLFTMQMFSQFAGVLGITRRDPMAGEPSFLSSLNLAQREAVTLAKQKTARIEFVGAPKITKDGGGTLLATVRVTNLAGHKFPSGVGFRRAFLQFQVLGSGDKVLFASGRTNSSGVILGPDGKPLPSEFTQDPALLQRHYQRITKATEVQIYEERVADDRGKLTTSFLALFRRIKDNRLLPKGFTTSHSSEYDAIKPHNVNDEALYTDGQNRDEVTYAIPLSELGGATDLRVEATLYYQSLPPYYLNDRFHTAQGPETQRLYLFSKGLDTSKNIGDWKLEIGGTGRVSVSR